MTKDELVAYELGKATATATGFRKNPYDHENELALWEAFDAGFIDTIPVAYY